jgi:mannose-6-phosphate isomerase-like protein (cupin superfamily)
VIDPRIIDVNASKSQVVLMSLLPGEEIGAEVHQGDQLLYAVKGSAVAVINGVKEPFEKGTMFCVPAGAEHNVINSGDEGDEPFKLFTVYAPPEHADGTVHETKAEADAAEAHATA